MNDFKTTINLFSQEYFGEHLEPKINRSENLSQKIQFLEVILEQHKDADIAMALDMYKTFQNYNNQPIVERMSKQLDNFVTKQIKKYK
jgi:hypothetical protein